MCFSAGASFGAGVVLSAIGFAAIKKAQTPSQIVFASIPLIFGIQQLTEGFVWLALSNTAYAPWQQATTYIFLTFAQVIWPSWVPVSILLLEKESKRKKILYIVSGIGLLVSFYLAFRLLTHSVHAEIIGRHIVYDLGFPVSSIRFFGILYFIATIIPSFISSIKRMWYLGFLILGSYIITLLFFKHYVISVWCFFAAIISGSVFLIVRDLQIHQAENENISPLIKA